MWPHPKKKVLNTLRIDLKKILVKTTAYLFQCVQLSSRKA